MINNLARVLVARNDEIMEDVNIHEKWMRLALNQAEFAAQIGEVPIGAVIVIEDQLIAKAHNLRELNNMATAHAELLVINDANQKLEKWRLEDATLYVTLEPCPMCAGAIILSRLKRVVYGAKDPKGGCVGSLMNLLEDPRFNHQPEVIAGVLEKECGQVLKEFFKKLRVRNKARKRNSLQE